MLPSVGSCGSSCSSCGSRGSKPPDVVSTKSSTTAGVGLTGRSDGLVVPSLASERAMLSQIDAYVGGDGGWASGEVDPDEDDYPSSGGSNGEDFGADDY